jgi:hypothetical protein
VGKTNNVLAFVSVAVLQGDINGDLENTPTKLKTKGEKEGCYKTHRGERGNKREKKKKKHTRAIWKGSFVTVISLGSKVGCKWINT